MTLPSKCSFSVLIHVVFVRRMKFMKSKFISQLALQPETSHEKADLVSIEAISLNLNDWPSWSFQWSDKICLTFAYFPVI